VRPLGPVWLARHGETEWNCSGRMQGRKGAPLTGRGLAQGRALAAAAVRVGVTRVITSPLERALVSATQVGSAVGCPLIVCDALMEADFGLCGGLTELEIEQRFPGLLQQRKREKWTHRWPRGESYADMVERVRPALEMIGSEPRTMIVAHQSVNRVITHLLADVSCEAVLAMAQPSDIVLAFELGTVRHARVTGEGGDLHFSAGLYVGGIRRAN
jgi:broad specificity phosphatase PhoE